MDRQIFISDSYFGPTRPLYLIELVENGTLQPLDLTGLTVETTFVQATDNATIPRADAFIYAKLVIDNDGDVVEAESEGLRLAGPVGAGLIYHELTVEQSGGLPVGVPLVSDVRTRRVDAVTGREEVTTFLQTSTLTGRFGITNRLEPAP